MVKSEVFASKTWKGAKEALIHNRGKIFAALLVFSSINLIDAPSAIAEKPATKTPQPQKKTEVYNPPAAATSESRPASPVPPVAPSVPEKNNPVNNNFAGGNNNSEKPSNRVNPSSAKSEAIDPMATANPGNSNGRTDNDRNNADPNGNGKNDGGSVDGNNGCGNPWDRAVGAIDDNNGNGCVKKLPSETPTQPPKETPTISPTEVPTETPEVTPTLQRGTETPIPGVTATPTNPPETPPVYPSPTPPVPVHKETLTPVNPCTSPLVEVQNLGEDVIQAYTPDAWAKVLASEKGGYEQNKKTVDELAGMHTRETSGNFWVIDKTQDLVLWNSKNGEKVVLEFLPVDKCSGGRTVVTINSEQLISWSGDGSVLVLRPNPDGSFPANP